MAHALRVVTVGAEIRPPGDKSITHRALMLAALAQGASELRGALAAEDTRSTARVLRQLGVAVGPLRSGATVTVRGGPWRRPERALHCGNSGTTARLLLGLLAGQGFAARLTGDRSLRCRPMRRVTEPLTRMGARVRGVDVDRLPLTIEGGALRDLRFDMPVASAQVKSALVLAGLTGGVDVVVREPVQSRDHTERLLAFLGAPIESGAGEVHLAGRSFRASDVPPFQLAVPGDFSSATFMVAAALLAARGELLIRQVGVNPTRAGALGVLGRMGAALVQENAAAEGGEPVADLVVSPAALRGTEVAAGEVPGLIDEIPVLAVLASRARGETRFRSVAELRVKESDRLTRVAANLRAVGADAAVEGDDLVVAGDATAPPRGRVETGGDHRIAMAFAVLNAVPGARVTLSETASVAVSYPGFFEHLRSVAGG